jgi:uncharacterized protein with HEPN domain
MRLHAVDALAIAKHMTRESFLSDRTMQHAVIRCLTVIGEAANRVSADTRYALRDVPWAEAVGLRNVLVHEYQRIDLSRVWTIVETDLPPLVNALNAYLGNVD